MRGHRLIAFALALAAAPGCHRLLPFGPGALDQSGAKDARNVPHDGRGADLGANTGPLECQTYTMPSFSKACSVVDECELSLHQTDCCGSFWLIGIRASEGPRFIIEEVTCMAGYPACDCPIKPDRTDDGSNLVFSGILGVRVDCSSGACTTFDAACGKVCPAGLSCHECKVKTTIYAACSKSCTLDTECTDPALPKCESDGLGGKFCTAGGVGCGTP